MELKEQAVKRPVVK